MTDTNSCIRVRLHPFLHQVSGSTLMLKFDSSTICKPLLPREYEFYKRLPKPLRKFTADFKGVIEIQYEQDVEGTCRFYGIVPFSALELLQPSIDTTVNRDLPSALKNSPEHVVDFLQIDELRLKRSGSIELDDCNLNCYEDPTNKLKTGSRLNKRLTQSLNESQCKFILLENLVANLDFPSILDLKMGTRTHGDDDTDEKKAEKQLKAKQSTSSSLGVRLHGMQKYNKITGKYETLDKFAGLKLSHSELRQVLCDFVDGAERHRTEIIEYIIQRLKQFYDCVSQQDTFRFYSSSLLIIYDSRESLDHPIVNVKAIDFAHTTCQLSSLDQQYKHTGPDKGYLQGIQTLINIFSEYTN